MNLLLVAALASACSSASTSAATETPATQDDADTAATPVAAQPPTSDLSSDRPVDQGDTEVAPPSTPTVEDPPDDARQTTTDAISVLLEGASIPGANGIFFDAQDRLWVASITGGLMVLDPETGDVLAEYGEAEGVLSPDDVVVADDGTAYFTNTLQGTIGRISPDGTGSEVASLDQGVNSIALRDDNTLYVGLNFAGDGLWEIDVTGANEPRLVIEQPGWINAMAFGPDGFLYGPRWTEGTIVRIDPATGEMVTIADDFDTLATAVKFNSLGELHAVERSPQHVVSVDLDTGQRTVLATYDRVGDNLAFDSNDRLYISSAEDGAIHEVLADGTLRAVRNGGIVEPSGVTVQVVDDREEVTIMTTHAFWTIDGQTGEPIEHRSLDDGRLPGVGLGAGIRIDGSELLVAQWAPGEVIGVWDLEADEVSAELNASFAMDVIRFDGEIFAAQHFGGAGIVTVSDAAQGEPPEFFAQVEQPVGLAKSGTNLYVTSFPTGNVLQLIADGEPQPPKNVASGLVQPEGIAALPDGNLVVVETASGDVVHIDVTTGEMRVLAESLSPAFSWARELFKPWSINGIAAGPSGNVYVSSPGDGTVYRLDVEALLVTAAEFIPSSVPPY